MPGNDLTAQRALVPQPADTRSAARANITELLNDILDDIEPKVTPAAMDMSSDLSFLSGGSYNAATNLGYVNMEDRSADPTVNESIYTKSNELWYKDGNSNPVQLTAGGAATAGSSGDIGTSGSPAYAASSVRINWDAVTSEYRFKTGPATSDLADLVMDKSRFDDGSGTYATLGAPGSMAATLDFLLPGTHPGSTSVMTMTSAGAMAHTRALAVDSLTLTGNLSYSGAVSWSTNKEVYHGPAEFSVWGDPSDGQISTTSTPFYVVAGAGASSIPTFCQLRVPEVGSIINEVRVSTYQAAAGTLTAEVFSVNKQGSVVSLGSGTSTTWSSFVDIDITGIAATTAADKSYFVKITTSGTGLMRTAQVRLKVTK